VAITPTTCHDDETAIPAELQAIPGLDVVQGLNTLDGHLHAYLRLLRRYAADHGDDMTLLRERLAQDNGNEARRLAHTLKGSSANLGATTVKRLAAELERRIRDGDDAGVIEQQIRALEIELQQLTTAILTALPEDAASRDQAGMAWAALKPVLTELESLLAAANVQANSLFASHAEQLKTALGPLGEELEYRIHRFLYPEALETLELIDKAARSHDPGAP
jgi:two-component system sensor histidine kinase/response regulator